MTFAEKMERAATSSLARLAFTIGTPVFLAIGAFFFGQMHTDLKAVTESVAAMQSDLRYVNARLDERVIRNVDAHGARLDSHDARLRVIETDVQVLKNTVRTP